MDELDGKVAFITGGASGIGLGMARAFAEAGMKLVLADIDEAALATAAASLAGTEVLTLTLDVRDRARWAECADAAEARFGALHVLCNNAGITALGWDMDQLPDEIWDLVVDINLTGVFNGVRAVLPRIKRHGQGGHIVNTASISGLRGRAGHTPYVGTKHALIGISESLRLELETHDIGVSVLCPGAVRSTLLESSQAVRAQVDQSEAPRPQLTGLALPNAHEPVEVGRRVVAAIRANQLFILTHPEYRTLIEERHRQVLAALDRAERLPG